MIEDKNDVEIISKNKLVQTSFYKYDTRIKKTYLFNQIDKKYKKYRINSIKYNLYKLYDKIQHKITKYFIMKKKIDDYKNVDVIIFGRVFIALEFLPFMKNFNAKIIVRDAIHLNYFNRKIRYKIKKYFPKKVSTFIVSSEESIEAYKKFFVDTQINLVKIYNPIGIKPIKSFNFQNKTVVSIGRMDDNQKGFDNLIKSFSLVRKKHNDWKLEIYGDGKEKNELEELIKKLGAQDFIELKPTTKDVVKVFNNSSIFVLASRYEGYANILVEALLCGIPSISYDWLMGVEEIIKDDVNGAIVRLHDRNMYFKGKSLEMDCENLAKKINYFIENEKKCESISNEATKIISNRTQELIISKWMELIKNH